MINKSPTNLDKFPVPVTGQEIPKGWFARLVSFINSLVLHGDGQYLAVSHNMSGTTIKPTPALLQLASARGAAPSSGGGEPQDISASVDGGTASIVLSGSTSAVKLVGTGDVTISGNTETGAIEINTTGGGGDICSFFPDYDHPIIPTGQVEMDTAYSFATPVWVIGEVFAEADENRQLRGDLFITGIANVFHAEGDFDSDACLDRAGSPVSLPVPANRSFQLMSTTQATNISLLAVYPCIGQTPSGGYTVFSTSGTYPSTLYYGLSSATDDSIVFSHATDNQTCDMGGAITNGSKTVTGNGYTKTTISGSVSCTSATNFNSLGMTGVSVLCGTMTLLDVAIPSGGTVSVSNGAQLDIRTISGGSGATVMLGATRIPVNEAGLSAQGIVFSGGSVSGTAGVIEAYNRSAVFSSCTFIGNAGLYNIYTGGSSPVRLTDCTLVSGGSYGILADNAILSRCTISAYMTAAVRMTVATGIMSATDCNIGQCVASKGKIYIEGTNNRYNQITGASGTVYISSGASINLANAFQPGGGVVVLAGGCTINGADFGSSGGSTSYTKIVSSGGSAVAT